VLRIALFGDSFTHGDNVVFENTWGYYLENNLKVNGINAEVLNLGVPGYGIDQAYLRWKQLGDKFSPDIVILGFFADDITRNVNLIRPLHNFKSDIPLSKPRFILEEDHLTLVNNPTPLPEKVPEIMAHLENWNLVKYEYFYTPKKFQTQIGFQSKLIALVLDAISRSGDVSQKAGRWSHYYQHPQTEPFQLTLKIIGQFKSDVEANGGHFLVVNLPNYKDLAAHLGGERWVYSKLLEKVEHDAPLIRLEHQMLEEAKASSLHALFADRYSATKNAVVAGHYSVRGNRVVANVITKFILDQGKSFPRRVSKR